MNFLSLNIRGVGEDCKVLWVRRLRKKHKLSFIAIQETQISDAEHIDVAACWGSNEFGVSRVNSVGRSDGLLNLWDRNFYFDEDNLLTKLPHKHWQLGGYSSTCNLR